MNSCNPTCTPTVFDAFSEAYNFPNLFGMCLNKWEGGVIDVGEVDNNKFTGELMYTPITNERYLAGKKLN